MSVFRFVAMGCVGLGLAGCGAGGAIPGVPGGPALVSAQYPPGTGLVNSHSEPQPQGSLPPGAANVTSAPGATQNNSLAWTFGAR